MSLVSSFESFLRQLDIQFTEENEGRRILFQRDGMQYVFLYDPQDPVYFRILLPRIAHIDNPNREQLLRLLTLSAGFKAGKVYYVGNDVWLAFEQFVTSADADVSSIFRRGFSVLTDMRNDYNRNNENRDEE